MDFSRSYGDPPQQVELAHHQAPVRGGAVTEIPNYTLTDVIRLMTFLTAPPTPLTTENREIVFTLEEISAMTKMSQKGLERDCRAGRVEHVRFGKLRGMTQAQITKLVQRYSVGGDLTPLSSITDELEQVREATRRSGARYRSRVR